MAPSLPARSEVAVEHTWDAASVFASPADWEAECDAVRGALPDLARFPGRLGEGPGVLLDFLALSEDLQYRLGRIAVYATLGSAVDSADQEAAARGERARTLAAEVRAALAFAEPELLALGVERLRGLAGEDPRLEVYAHWLDRLARRAPHVRSAEVEELLGLAADPLQGARVVHGLLADAELAFAPAVDASGEEHQVAQGTLESLLTSADRELRRSAWTSYADAHLGVRRTLAACLSAGVKRDVFLARARGYGGSLEAALVPNDLPLAVFHNVVDAFRAHLGVWHRYWRLRRRALGVDRLREYDVRAVLAPRLDVTYPQAVEWIADGLRPLGDDYVEVLRRGALAERWVDVYPNQGKRLGAFSTGVPGTHPFVFLSYTGSIFSVSTLAHELGHSMHRYLTTEHQPFVYANYGIFAAEVASNLHQALVRAHLLGREGDRDFQLAVLEEAMGNFHRYLLVMPTLARFELEVHERVERGEPLTADGLTELMAGLLAEAYGEEVEMDRERSGSMWAQFHTHLYNNFYVYQYTTGIAGAHALAGQILEEGAPAAERYRGFLSAGSSLYPLDALRRAGVDLERREPIDGAFEALEGYVERIEELLAPGG
jgi:oligoendopeptidase F